MQTTTANEKSFDMFSDKYREAILENLQQINTLIAETAEVLNSQRIISELQQFVEDEEREFDEYMLRMHEYYDNRSFSFRG